MGSEVNLFPIIALLIVFYIIYKDCKPRPKLQKKVKKK